MKLCWLGVMCVKLKMWKEILLLIFWKLGSISCEISSSKLFITGRSTFLPSNVYQWWFIPTQKPFKNNLQQILLTGTLYPGTMVNQWDAGVGKIFTESVWRSCIYMSNKGTLSGNPVDEPFTLSIAILCEIKSTNSLISEVVIFPTCSTTTNCSKVLVGSFLSLYPYVNLNSNLHSPRFLQQYQSLSMTTSTHAVCTVQTFRNELTGPALFLFIQYYLELNWIVIVFDRFGDHSHHISSFLDHQQFFYFPFTILTNIFPDLYNEAYRHNQTNTFAHFNKLRIYQSGSQATTIQNSEEGNQNSDKRKSYIFARQLFSKLPAMLFVDRDELFFCPAAAISSPLHNVTSRLAPTPSSPSSSSASPSPPLSPLSLFQAHLLTQRLYQDEYIQELLSSQINRLSLPRVMYSSQRVDETRDHLNYLSIVKCVESVYHPNSTTSLETLREMLTCFGGNLVANKIKYSRKSMELSVGGICPFNGIHVLCQRCKCKESRPSTERCHLIHFGWINRPFIKQQSSKNPQSLPDFFFLKDQYLKIFQEFLVK